ncbi:hypothetical protein [Mycolicibacterium phage Kashi_SSH1]|nr:hypothetical protein [Mycolicibacterium phage Kashi_SSH1]
MQRHEHYIAAEDLIAEGERTAAQISDVKDQRALVRKHTPQNRERIDHLTQRMDELGKKARGIWAQALVHAELARVEPGIDHMARLTRHRREKALAGQKPPSEVPDDLVDPEVPAPRYEIFSIAEEDSN